MTREEAREKLSALVDGELSPAEAAAVRARLEQDPNLRDEYEQLAALRGGLRLALDPPAVSEREWDLLALRVVSRQTRRVGWALFLPGVLGLLVGLGFAFFVQPWVPLWLRLSSGAAIAGLAFLLVAALADRLRFRRVERYDEVQQ
jgi:anti-sigma factor RsiW